MSIVMGPNALPIGGVAPNGMRSDGKDRLLSRMPYGDRSIMPRGVPGPVKQSQKKKDPRFEGTNLPGPGPGRPKGKPNRFTSDVRDAILAGINGAHPDGIAGFVLKLAEANPAAAAALLGRFVPMQSEIGKPGDFSRMTDEQLRGSIKERIRRIGIAPDRGGAETGEESPERAGRLN